MAGLSTLDLFLKFPEHHMDEVFLILFLVVADFFWWF
jgi:hypothetical protein